MKKLIALTLSIHLIVGTNLPLLAGGGNTVLKILPRAIEPASETMARAGLNASVLSSAERSLSAAGTLGEMYRAPSLASAGASTASQAQLAAMNLRVKRELAQAQLNELLEQPLLKETGLTKIHEFSKAVTTWGKTIVQQADEIAQHPASFTIDKLQREQAHKDAPKPHNETLQKLLSQISAIGIFGNAEHDAPVLWQACQKALGTPVEDMVVNATARALLRLEAYETLALLAEKTPHYSFLWQGIGRVAQERNLPIEVAELKSMNLPTGTINLLSPYGQLVSHAANPFYKATVWYMDLGKLPGESLQAPVAAPRAPQAVDVQTTTPAAAPEPKEVLEQTSATPAPQAVLEPLLLGAIPALPANLVEKPAPAPSATLVEMTPAPVQVPILHTPDSYAQTKERLGRIDYWEKSLANARAFLQSPEFKHRLEQAALDKSTPLQRASLYTASFVIGLEIGTPIIASLGSALGLSLEENILVTVATYFPYSVGAFFTNWLMGKIGRKATMNIGLTLMGGSFLAGASLLGLDGNFLPWLDKLSHYYSILGALTTASLGGVLIHNAAGPIMTEISKHASELTLQKRGTRVELARAGGMLSSFAFPFIATSMLGMDWSAPFLMALPFVGAAALGLNLAKLPNSKPAIVQTAKQQVQQSWAKALKDNKYVRLFKEDKSVAPLLGGLFLMNGVEMAYNSGFLFLLPSLTTNPSSQYLFGLTQFALPFVLGRYMASKFLDWFPKHNLSIATAISALGGLAATGLSHNVYALTAALFTAEMGISTAFTLAFARTAKNTVTQDRITSLIIASALACAVGPVVFSTIAQSLINNGIFNLQDATAVAMIGVPSLFAMWSAGLFKKVEQLVDGAFSEKLSSILKKLRNLFPHRNTSIEE